MLACGCDLLPHCLAAPSQLCLARTPLISRGHATALLPCTPSFIALDASPLLAAIPLLFYSSPAGEMGECLPHLRQSGSRDRRPRRSGELQDDSKIMGLFQICWWICSSKHANVIKEPKLRVGFIRKAT